MDRYWKNASRNRSRVLPDTAFLNLTSVRSFKEDGPTFSCHFHSDNRYSHVFVYCNENGFLNFGDTRLSRGNEPDPISARNRIIVGRLEAHQNAIFECQWQPMHANHIFTASGDQTAALWDMQERKRLCVFKGHTGSVKALSVCPENPNVFITGGRDGNVMLWDIRDRQTTDGKICPKVNIAKAHDPFERLVTPKIQPSSKKGGRKSSTIVSAPSVSAVLFHEQHSAISGGTRERLVLVQERIIHLNSLKLSSDAERFQRTVMLYVGNSGIRFWDIRKLLSTSRKPAPYKILQPALSSFPRVRQGTAFTSFSVNPYDRSTLYASCTDGIIYAYSLVSKSLTPINGYRGAQIRSFYIQTAVCPTAPYLLSGSGDGRALIWRLDNDENPLYVLPDVGKEVESVAWNDQFELLTFAEDCTWRLWTLDNAAVPESCHVARSHLYVRPQCATAEI